jgi:hypothetical protein
MSRFSLVLLFAANKVAVYNKVLPRVEVKKEEKQSERPQGRGKSRRLQARCPYQVNTEARFASMIMTSNQRNLSGITVVLKGLPMATADDIVTPRTTFCRGCG